MSFPPLFIIVFHISAHAIVGHIVLQGTIEAAHLVIIVWFVREIR